MLIPFQSGNHQRKKLSVSLKAILGYKPGNIRLYEIAFIHKSASIQHPDGSMINNERLEYLGDAILDAVVSDLLFSHFPGKNEGDLTRIRSQIVKREKLNELASLLHIGDLLVSHTDQNRHVKHLAGNTLEALIGAIYLDKGFYKTKTFILRRIIRPHIDLNRLEQENIDHKSQLIEWSQKKKEELQFRHDQKNQADGSTLFTTTIYLNGNLLGTGTGYSKKESEQKASRDALAGLP